MITIILINYILTSLTYYLYKYDINLSFRLCCILF